MVVFDFKQEFVDSIKDGSKKSTIRKTKRCNIGDKLQFYTGQRTKNCQKIANAKCVGIAKVIISDEKIWEISDAQGWHIRDDSKITLHQCEGFDNAKHMLEFFRKEYGLPYKGYVHFWEIDNV